MCCGELEQALRDRATIAGRWSIKESPGSGVVHFSLEPRRSQSPCEKTLDDTVVSQYLRQAVVMVGGLDVS